MVVLGEAMPFDYPKIVECVKAGLRVLIRYPEYGMEIAVGKRPDQTYHWVDTKTERSHVGINADEVVRCAWTEAVRMEA